MTKNVFAYGDQRISPIYRYCTVFTQLFDYSGPLALSEIGKSAIDFGFAGHIKCGRIICKNPNVVAWLCGPQYVWICS